MNYMKFSRHSKLPALALAVLALAATPSIAVELAAVEATASMPDGNAIAMWGFIDVADAATFNCATVNPSDPWSVGPELVVTPGGDLTVNIKNCLADPVSVFIPGQLKATSPATFVDGQGRSRVRSFDAETAAGAVGSYTWTAVKEGTYLYHSGTHPQVQVQMGLYGALIVRPSSINYVSTVLADAPIHYYRLGESTIAQPAVDETGGSDGTYGSAVTLPVPGMLADGTDTAAGFVNTANSFVDTSVTSQSGGPFSVEAWVTANAIGTGGHRIVAKDEIGVPGHFILWFQNGRLRFHVRNTSGQWKIAQAPISTTPAVGTPFHVAGVFDGTDAILYVDGAEVGRTALVTPTSNTNTLPITIGADSDPINPRGHSFDGTIDEVAIYDLALTGPQIQAHFDSNVAVAASVYAAEAVLVYSEIDPALHAAVADGSYGTAAYPSTFDYKPRYFLINGAAYPAGADIAVTTGDVLLRFVNAGLKTHVPTLGGGLYMSLIAEDGNRYPFEVEQYGVELQAAKTIDAVVQVGTEGRYALYDRALGLNNWFDTGGGMLTYLDVSPGAGLFELSLAGYDVAENGASLTVTVNRVGGSAGAASVDYATADGTATNPADYTTTAGNLSYLDGETSATFNVPIADNLVYEGDKTFSVALSNATGAALGAQASAVVTITEDEPQPPTLQFSAAAYGVAENGGTITVTVDRVGASTGEFTVDYATADGTATTADLDYAAANGTLTFADTVISATFDVSILDDATNENDEAFSVALSNPSVGAFLGTPFGAVVTINDDDAANVAPIANDDTFSRPRGNTPVTFDVVANDEDPDCGTGSPCIDATSVVITTGSQSQRGGTVVNNGDGTVDYTPRNRGFRGTDTFQYTVEDDPNGIPGDHDGLTSNVATVRINVVSGKSTVETKSER